MNSQETQKFSDNVEGFSAPQRQRSVRIRKAPCGLIRSGLLGGWRDGWLGGSRTGCRRYFFPIPIPCSCQMQAGQSGVGHPVHPSCKLWVKAFTKAGRHCKVQPRFGDFHKWCLCHVAALWSGVFWSETLPSNFRKLNHSAFLQGRQCHF